MKILVCGSRTWSDGMLIQKTLELYGPGHTLIHGTASGADQLAQKAATFLGWGIERYPAEWGKHGRAAGPIRNTRMLVEGKPDLVIAFSLQPLTPGTANMVSQARGMNVPVRIVS